jgi:hypothetical protein
MGQRNAALRQKSACGRASPWAVAGAIAAAMGLAGCASTSQTIADRASQLPVVGLSADAPARPADPVAYPAVHDMPPPRHSVVLTGLEQQKLEADLVAARDRQQAAAGITPANRKAKDAKSARNAKLGTAKSGAAKPATSGSTAD